MRGLPCLETLESRILASVAPPLHLDTPWRSVNLNTVECTVIPGEPSETGSRTPVAPTAAVPPPVKAPAADPATPSPTATPTAGPATTPTKSGVDIYPSNPSDGGTYTFTGGPLFAPGGPVAADVQQRSINDCYLMADLASLAADDPAWIETLVQPDSTAGMYVVTFTRFGRITRVHVDGEISSVGAQPGDDGALWAVVIEKAYACFRSGKNTYGSLNVGSADAAGADLGIGVTDAGISGLSAAWLTSKITAELAAGKLLVINTAANAGPLVGNHSYAVTAVTMDASDTVWVTLTNPWGSDEATVSIAVLTQVAADLDYQR
jgi:hypothetical protein